jgi:hypothetical protein
MPLPTASIAWPPRQLAQITPILTAWSAWWTGQPDALRRAYTVGRRTTLDRPSQYLGGVTGMFSRFWWGRPVGDLTQVHDQTHVPIAADLARTSSDLLFADPPTFKVDDPATQARLDDTVGDYAYAALAGAGEVGAALGGVYLRVTWDKDVTDRAFLTVVNADAAWPEFSWDRLRAVTFWHVVEDNGSVVFRHLERHEVVGGYGVVQHGLYVGTVDRLGRPMPLAEHAATAPLATEVDEAGYLRDGRTPGLDVVYIPNCHPSVAKAFTRLPAADGWGASDLDGVEPLLDNLDEAYSSWMRDLRLAKARILVAQYMLDDQGNGNGAAFAADREVFTTMNMAPGESADAPITMVQFAIRFAEHKATVDEWTSRILRSAGYSLDSFGEGTEARITTATEVTARQSRSLQTRDRKIRAWRPALTEIMAKLLEVDAAVFGKAVDTEGMAVEFSDGSTPSALSLAQTAQALSVAQAASTHTLVALVHPDWDDTRISEEVDLIAGEKGTPVPDPFAIGQTPAAVPPVVAPAAIGQ